MITVADLLLLPVLEGATLVAGRRGIGTAVRWTHVSEVLDIARLLEGGELLLTTGLALDVPPERQRAYVKELKERKVAGIMLELGRRFDQVPEPLVQAADEFGLPLIALPYDTRFVKVSEAVHRAIIAADRGSFSDRLLGDLLNGRVSTWTALLPLMQQAGVALTEPAWLCAVVIRAGVVPHLPTRGGALRGFLGAQSDGEYLLIAFGGEAAALADALAAWVRRLGVAAAGVGGCYRDLNQAERSLAEARCAARLRQHRSWLDPRLEQMGVYALLPAIDPAVLTQFVRRWLGPLLDYEASHRGPLLETLRVLLDEGPVTEAASRLYISRQALYSRRERIAALLGVDLGDAEVRLALSVALRLYDSTLARS